MSAKIPKWSDVDTIIARHTIAMFQDLSQILNWSDCSPDYVADVIDTVREYVVQRWAFALNDTYHPLTTTTEIANRLNPAIASRLMALMRHRDFCQIKERCDS